MWIATALMVALWISGPGVEALAKPDTASDPARGVVIESVAKESALAKAGIKPGDVLLSWRRLPAPPGNPEEAFGGIDSVFDWMWLALEQSPRGTVELLAKRGEEEKLFPVELGLWKAAVRPQMSEKLLTNHSRATKLQENGDFSAAVAEWTTLAKFPESPLLRCWAWLRIGDAWAEAREWREADAAYQSTIEDTQDPFLQSLAWDKIGKLHESQNEFILASEAYQKSKELRESLWGHDNLAVAGALHDLGAVAYHNAELDQASVYLLDSLEILRELAPLSPPLAESLNTLGLVAVSRRQLDEADSYFSQSLMILEKISPDSLLIANLLNNMGLVAWQHRRLAKAQEYLERSLKIKEKKSPQGLDYAQGLNNLGGILWKRGDVERAADYMHRALEIRENLAPDSLHVANTLANTAVLAHQIGDLDLAITYYDRAVKIHKRLAPKSIELAQVYTNMGVILEEQGDLDRSMYLHEQALELMQKSAPDGLDTAAVFGNLGVVAAKRGEWDRAKDLHQSALAIKQKLAPDSLEVASSLHNVGVAAKNIGDLESARVIHQRALEIRQQLAPESLAEAHSLSSLGTLAAELGEIETALNFHNRAMEIRQAVAPESLDFATSLRNLGHLADQTGNLSRARDLYFQALRIYERLVPQSTDVAVLLHKLGMLYYEAGEGDIEAANDFLTRALNTLENQLSRLGGSHDARGHFRSTYTNLYRDAMKLQIHLQDSAGAFHTSERARARSFLEHFTERDTVFEDIAPELDRERRKVAIRIDRVQRNLAEIDPGNSSSQRDDLNDQLRRLHNESKSIEEKIRRISPELAALRYPAALDLEGTREALDPGTVLLSYNLGKTETTVFAVTKEGLRIEILPIGDTELRKRIRAFRRQIEHSRRPGSQRMERLEEMSLSLYSSLIQPLDVLIEASDRLLILADGPLHYLPWSALVREPTEGRLDYLIEWKPLHLALSATVIAELKKLRRGDENPPPPIQIAAFGDPAYPGSRQDAIRHGDFVVRSAAERTLFDWDPLPHSRREVESIAGVYPEESVRTYLGKEATEEAAKALGRDVRTLHFATHSHFDERFPLNSFLALSIPEDFSTSHDNGLLQAWEIFERIRLDADLVVLSACETALGEERDGEGLYGLTRAFQFAGARTVAASLWRVADHATAELMTRFYRYLRSGMPKDEALRAAQLELIRGPIELQDEDGQTVEIDASSPYFWAAFQVYGDWR